MAKKAAKPAAKAAPKAAPKPAKITAAAKRSKSELYGLIGEHVGIARKQVAGVFEIMGAVMAADLAKPSKDKPKMFVVPGLMKVVSRFKAKPASTAIKIRPLKALKAMV
jgi:hypothetical protein